MKRRIAWLVCLLFCLQLATFGVNAVPEQAEVVGSKAFSQRLEEAYTIVETPMEDGVVLVELVMPTDAPVRRLPSARTVLAAFDIPGDLDGNGKVDVEDAIALVLYLSMPDLFSVEGNADIDKDGKENVSDAVLLLLHISMPDQFPLDGDETEPEPTEPEPTEPEPTEPEPAEPEPTEPEPTEPKPTEPEPTEPKPTEPEPTEPEPTEPEPTEPKPTEPEGHQTLPYTERYLYNTLTEAEKGWYRSIDTAVNNLEEQVFLGYNLPDDYHRIFSIYLMDNPEHFYLCSRYAYYPSSQAKLIFCYADGVNYCGYGYGAMTQALREGIAAKKAIFNEKVETIVAKIPTNIPDVEKEKMAYDYLLLNSYYNMDAVTNDLWDGFANDNWTAYGIMVHGKGVCESYAEAFQTLCLRMGINCTGVEGVANGGGHKWNAVQLDGQWYACDVTFDDPIGGAPDYAYHDYFNITTKEMENLEHSTEGSKFPGPNCTATKYSYTNYFEK